TANDAATMAARAAVVEAARGIEPALAQRWSTAGESGPAGGVTVRVHGIERWAEYQALTRALASLPGVAAVEPRRFVRGEMDLLVRTASVASQLAGHLQRVPPQSVRIGVLVGAAVLVPSGSRRVEVRADGWFTAYRDVVVPHDGRAAVDVALRPVPETE